MLVLLIFPFLSVAYTVQHEINNCLQFLVYNYYCKVINDDNDDDDDDNDDDYLFHCYSIALNLKTYQFITMCKGDINRHQPKTAKVNLGLNHHVLNSRTALTRRAILNTCKMWCFLFIHVCLNFV